MAVRNLGFSTGVVPARIRLPGRPPILGPGANHETRHSDCTHRRIAKSLFPSRAPAESQRTAKTVSLARSNPQLLVAGSGSHNIVRFDLKTGESTVVAKLANGSRARSLAVNKAGEIFVGLRGNELNVVKLVPYRSTQPDGPLVAQKVTGRIGRFGPSLMAFDE